MKQQQIDQLSIQERASQATPKFFQTLRNIGLAMAAASGAILAAPVVLPAAAITVAGYLAVAGSVAAAVSQVTVESK